MKNLLLLSALTLSGMAGAQTEQTKRTPKSAEEKAAIMTKKMTENLKLTPEQVAKIEPENLAFFQQQEAHQEQMKALRDQHKMQAEQHKEKIKAILTPEQQKKAEKMMNKRKEKRHKRMERRMNRD
jgi:Spy/CpxP family protein refolding chaperone